jgi:hypothetical protein
MNEYFTFRDKPFFSLMFSTHQIINLMNLDGLNYMTKRKHSK